MEVVGRQRRPEAAATLAIAGGHPERSEQALLAQLARLGLESKRDAFPHQLSGGEMQRVSIARALSGGQKLLFADEPTGNLSQKAGLEVMQILRGLVDDVYVDDSVKRYVVDLINTTRHSGPRPIPGFDRHVRVGASPRGGIALMRVGQALAVLAGRAFVVPDDIKAVRYSVLRHRLVRTFDALAHNVPPEQLVDAVFDAVPTP